MEFVNFAISNKEKVGRDVIERALLLLAPFAPHLTEELWHQLGFGGSVHKRKEDIPPVWTRNYMRNVVDAMTGNVGVITTCPYPITPKKKTETK